MNYLMAVEEKKLICIVYLLYTRNFNMLSYIAHKTCEVEISTPFYMNKQWFRDSLMKKILVHKESKHFDQLCITWT